MGGQVTDRFQEVFAVVEHQQGFLAGQSAYEAFTGLALALVPEAEGTGEDLGRVGSLRVRGVLDHVGVTVEFVGQGGGQTGLADPTEPGEGDQSFVGQ